MDHWSFAYPCNYKQACCWCECSPQLLHLPHFGVSRILNSYNGREFTNKVIEELLKSWHIDIQPVSGRPCHPHSQGLVEWAHYTLQQNLSAEISRVNSDSPPCSKWLPHIVCKLNKNCSPLSQYFSIIHSLEYSGPHCN